MTIIMVLLLCSFGLNSDCLEIETSIEGIKLDTPQKREVQMEGTEARAIRGSQTSNQTYQCYKICTQEEIFNTATEAPSSVVLKCCNHKTIVGENADNSKNAPTPENIHTRENSTLLNTMSSLNKEKAEELERAQRDESLTLECIEDIRSHNFEAAQKKLELIKDDNKINFIVNQVYNNETASFSLVSSFGGNISDVNRRFLFYKALNYEMENNGHRDMFHMIALSNRLQDWDIYVKGEARNLIRNLRTSIKSIMKDKLKNGLLHGNYKSLANDAQAIYFYSSELFKEIMEEVVDEGYAAVNLDILLKWINDLIFVPQIVLAYTAVLNKMERNGDLYTDAIFKVAFHFKGTIGDYLSNNPELKNRLPLSVRNAVFASRVCIKSTLRQEYLVSDRALGKTHDENRGWVYTWLNGSKTIECVWDIERDGDAFYIRNSAHNEYLHSDNHTFDNDRGYVFTWIPHDRVPEGRWKIEPAGDNCYIKHVVRNEYIYSARIWGRPFDEYRGAVYTWIPGSKDETGEWTLEDCSSSRISL